MNFQVIDFKWSFLCCARFSLLEGSVCTVTCIYMTMNVQVQHSDMKVQYDHLSVSLCFLSPQGTSAAGNKTLYSRRIKPNYIPTFLWFKAYSLLQSHLIIILNHVVIYYWLKPFHLFKL